MSRYTIRGLTNPTATLGKGESSTQNWLFRGYASSQESIYILQTVCVLTYPSFPLAVEVNFRQLAPLVLLLMMRMSPLRLDSPTSETASTYVVWRTTIHIWLRLVGNDDDDDDHDDDDDDDDDVVVVVAVVGLMSKWAGAPSWWGCW